MIASVGESLVDFTPVEAGGRLDGFRLRPGGSPCNVAVGVARLGRRAAFAGRLSNDLFGSVLAGHLAESGVSGDLLLRGTEPTALAFVAPRGGEAVYDFRIEGTAATALEPADLPPSRFASAEALHFGSLGLLFQPCRLAILGLARELHGRVPLWFDPNLRPEAVRDWAGYRPALAEALGLADLVKVSERDLEAWGEDVIGLRGGRPVVVTRGANGSRAHVGGAVVECPARPSRVIDTVGAGDAYTAGLLVALAERGALGGEALAGLSPDAWLAAMRFASAAAALTCERPGADLPRRAEVEARM